MDAINILIECQKKHRKSIYVLVTSIVKNKYEESKYCIYLYVEDEKEPFLSLLQFQEENIEIKIITKEFHLSELGKTICLMWNTIVNGDLTGLFEYDLENCAVAAVSDIASKFYYIPNGKKNYDASVLLINLRKINDIKSLESSKNEVKKLPIIYNFNYSELVKNKNKYNKEELKEIAACSAWDLKALKKEARILRLEKDDSPERYFDNILSGEWLEYYKLSPLAEQYVRREAYVETRGKITLLETERGIPISFFVSDRDVSYAVALIYSILEHMGCGWKLDLRITYCNLTERHKEILLSLESQRCSIILYNIQRLYEDSYDAITLIPFIFDEYKKVISLNPRMICLRGIEHLYKYPVERFYYSTGNGNIKGNDQDGILLINTEKWIQNNVSDRIREQIGKKKRRESLQDLCSEKVGRLPYTWEYRCGVVSDANQNNEKECKELFNIEKLAMLYYDKGKSPWLYPEESYAEFVWKYISHSAYSEELICEACEYDYEEEIKVQEQEMKEQLEILEKQNKELMQQIRSLETQNATLNKEKSQFLFELLETRKSITYKVGRMITFIPRMMRGDK